MEKNLGNLYFLKDHFLFFKKYVLVGLLLISQLSLFAQQLTVTGRITDSQTGNVMPGVNILIRGTTTGTISDAGGRYSITVTDPNAILVFSFIGYNTVEQPVSGRNTVDIALVPTTESLDEVIVIGYGTQKKSDLTGSVVRVTMADKAT